MADEKNILFSGEFDGQGIAKGVDEILSSLEKVQEAEVLVKTAINETTKAMKENRKEAEKLAKQKPLDPKNIEAQAKQLEKLNEQYEELVHQNAELVVVQKKVNSVGKEYTKIQREQQKNSEEVGKAIKKFTNVNSLAADGIKKVGNFAKDAAFGLVSGFAGGILASVVPAIIDWIAGMSAATDEMTKLKKQKETLNEVFTNAAKAVGDDVAKLEVYRTKLNDTNIPAAERIKIAKEYNKTADETNKIDLKQIDNLELINIQIEKQNKLILQRAISTAALAKLTEESTKFVDAQLKLSEGLKRAGVTEAQVNDQIIKQAADMRDARENQINSLDGYSKSIDINLSKQEIAQKKTRTFVSREIQDLGNLIGVRDNARRSLDDLSSLLSPLITPDGLTTPGGKTPTDKAIQNVFEQRLAELRARLAAASASTFQSEKLIQDKFSAQLDKEVLEIGRLLKEKKLTIPQADILKGVLKQINDIELTKGLDEFRKKREEAMNRVNDLLIQAQLENETKRINNLRDEFQREQAQVEINYQQSVEQINKRSEDFRKKIDADTKLGLLSPELARRKKFIGSLLFGGLLEEAEQARINAGVDLAFKQFNKTLETARQGFEGQLLVENERTTKLIGEQTQLFMKGKLTYEQYQKALTKILREESAERRKIQLAEAQDQLRLIDEQLSKTTDEAQRKQLEQQRNQLRLQISQLQREVAGGDSEDKNKAEDERIKKLLDYVNAVNQLATAVVGFWQQVNQAEQAALDRSIGLQNKRVENARQLAEKGNAEFLELEQKRLDELERKREKNARRQIAINNALTASQAIVAAITAIAQATQSGSALAAVAAVAAVIGAIGAAYSFVNSLQPQEANFFEGTPYVQGKEGRDKVPANLTKGERVTTVKDNKDYWDTLEAIRTRRISPEVMNSFVESYPNNPVPVVDFDRISSATDGKLGHDSLELLNRVDRLNGTMEQVVVGLSEIGVNVKMDSEGFEASISKARKQRVLRSRS